MSAMLLPEPHHFLGVMGLRTAVQGWQWDMAKKIIRVAKIFAIYSAWPASPPSLHRPHCLLPSCPHYIAHLLFTQESSPPIFPHLPSCHCPPQSSGTIVSSASSPCLSLYFDLFGPCSGLSDCLHSDSLSQGPFVAFLYEQALLEKHWIKMLEEHFVVPCYYLIGSWTGQLDYPLLMQLLLPT